MKEKINIKVHKKDIDRLHKADTREQQKSDGMFDGRYKTKSVKSAKEYSRNTKHKL